MLILRMLFGYLVLLVNMPSQKRSILSKKIILLWWKQLSSSSQANAITAGLLKIRDTLVV